MKNETNIEIKGIDGLLLFEINDRIKHHINQLNKGLKLEKKDIELLKIDKDTLENRFGTRAPAMAYNLKKKAILLIKIAEEE